MGTLAALEPIQPSVPTITSLTSNRVPVLEPFSLDPEADIERELIPLVLPGLPAAASSPTDALIPPVLLPPDDHG